MSWDWQFYCNDTATQEAVAGCLGPGGKEQTYLQWMLSAWGWTLEVSVAAHSRHGPGPWTPTGCPRA